MKKEVKREETILCAAIHFDDGKQYNLQPKNIDSGIVLCGFRHGCIFPQIGGLARERHELGIYERSQGFLTSRNRYVEREEALIIALKNNQVIDMSEIRGDRLFSEDLY